MKIAIIAGEVSGDRLGAQLVGDLRALLPEATFIGVTGEQMAAAGVRSLASIDRLSLHGLFEILPKLPKLFLFRAALRRQILAEKPDLVVGVDAPAFNIGLLRALRREGCNTMQMVCPTIWAWRAGRINAIKQAVSAVLTLYPFEEALLQKAGIASFCLGHPLAQEIPLTDATLSTRELMRIKDDEMVITLLPGSRVSEIHRHTVPIVRAAMAIAKRWQDEGRSKTLKFVAPLPTRQTIYAFEMAQYLWQKKHPELKPPPIALMRGHANRAIAMSDFCLCGSGTVTLEVALYHKPMVVFYYLQPLTLWLMRRLYRLPWFALPNILMQRLLVPELLQKAASGEAIAEKFFQVWDDAAQKKALQTDFLTLHESLRQPRLERVKAALQHIGILPA